MLDSTALTNNSRRIPALEAASPPRRPSVNRTSLASALLTAAALATAIFPAATLAQSTHTSTTQTPTEKPLAFEVVSIRPDPESALGHDKITVTPNGWHMTHGSLLAALLTAYVPTTSEAMMYTSSTLVGIPDWVKHDTWTIDAKVADSDIPAWRDPATQPAMLRSMMQSLLADRCKLALHRGSKEVTVYLLVIGKNGPRLKPAHPGEPHPGATALPGGGEFLQNDGTGNAAFFDAPLRALTVVLSNFADRPVVDKTGLTGRYDMVFRRPRLGGPSIQTDPGSDPPPTVFDVVESLGLKLQSAKSSVQTLVIDHIEKPSEN